MYQLLAVSVRWGVVLEKGAFKKMIFHRFSLVLAVITVSIFVLLASGYCQEQETAPEKDVSSLAKLSDEQVRNLLIAELTSKEKEEQATQEFLTLNETIVNWLHLFDADTGDVLESRVDALLRAAVHMPEYLLDVFLRFGKGTGVTSALVNVLFIVLIFVIGYLVVLVYKAIVPKFDGHSTEQEIPEMGGYMRFWAGVMRMISGVAVLAVFTVVVLGMFFSTPLMEIDGSRYLFLAVLLTILILRLGALISHLICSPVVSGLRLLAITDKTARTTHRIILFVLAYVAVSLSTIGVISELGMPENGVYVIIILLGSLLLFLTAGILVANRQTIADYILSAETFDAGGNWVMHQFARLWHILALLYLFSVWAIFLHQQVMGIRSERPAFLLSLLILPLFLVLDRIAHWVVEVSIKLLKIYNEPEEGKTAEEPEELTAEEKEKLLIVKVFRWVRIMILLALLGWFLHIWGYSLPFFSTLTEIVFRSLLTMALALLAWRIISGYIEKKLLEEEPDEPVEEDQDSEWGSSVARGRAYTLLPMLRKFIGTVLAIMVILTVLSTIGIEIGPLLAGAGVVGLAVGFGAQKLVSDVFSGFFFKICKIIFRNGFF